MSNPLRWATDSQRERWTMPDPNANMIAGTARRPHRDSQKSANVQLCQRVFGLALGDPKWNYASTRPRQPTAANGSAICRFRSSTALSEVNKTSCDAYVTWRTAQNVSDQTARHELKTLRAAINHYHASAYGPLDAVPVVTLPAKAERKIDYWLTRKMVAERIRAARKIPRCRHVVRLLLIGVYSGTRPGAAMALRWVPSTVGGWIDLESQTIAGPSPNERQRSCSRPSESIAGFCHT
jgi:integrase